MTSETLAKLMYESYIEWLNEHHPKHAAIKSWRSLGGTDKEKHEAIARIMLKKMKGKKL